MVSAFKTLVQFQLVACIYSGFGGPDSNS